MARRLVVFLVVALGTVFAAAIAQADTKDVIEKQNDPPTAKDGFQAGTCTTETPKCSPETPANFFKTAGGHPDFGFTQYIVKHKVEVENVLEEPEATVKRIKVDLPAGLTVNPLATERCPLATFEADETTCPASSKVGREEVTVALNLEIPNPFPGPPTLPKNYVIAPTPAPQVNTLVPLYNLEPNPGEPALFGFKVGPTKSKVFLTTEVSWESDYHESFEIVLPPPSPVFKSLKSRLVNFGKSGDGTYITNPTTCFNEEDQGFEGVYATEIRADSIQTEDPNFPDGSTPLAAPLPPGLVQEGCTTVPFDPSIEIAPGAEAIDSPSGPTVVTKLPVLADPEGQSTSHLRNAEVTLPQGIGLNPSAAPGLVACTTADFGKGTKNKVACPEGSKIGTVEIETPPLPAGTLTGPMYLGQQLSRDPQSGEEFRVFVNAVSDQYGVDVRLIGNTKANPVTGQLTTVFAENPQVPFESVSLKFDQSKGVLSSAPICGPVTATSRMEPWSTPASTKNPTAAFAVTKSPSGGACPTTLAARAFAPGYTAKSTDTAGGAYSPFQVHIGRTDGQQELKVVDVSLPPGLAGSLAGIPYCSDGALAAAAGKSGEEEKAAPSCGGASQVGLAVTQSGTGANPAKLGGKAYLAGPYKGAPLSMAIITPAVSGPFDLGTVVVRIAVNVDPETAQVRAVSDVIPDVYGGVKLDIRDIDVNLNRERFIHNPTNCDPKAVTGTLQGGGADPTNPAAFSSVPFSTPYQASGCDALDFKPKLTLKLLGGTQGDEAQGAPETAGHPAGRGQRREHPRAAVTLPQVDAARQRAHRNRLHQGAAGRRPVPERGDLRQGDGDLAAARQPGLRQRLPGVVRQQAAGPARRPQGSGRTSACAVSSAAPRRAACGRCSTTSRTPRSRSSP